VIKLQSGPIVPAQERFFALGARDDPGQALVHLIFLIFSSLFKQKSFSVFFSILQKKHSSSFKEKGREEKDCCG